MMRRRVVVTGMGTINPLGHNVADFWQQTIAGANGIRAIDAFAIPSHMSGIAGIVDGFNPQATESHLDRSLQFALHATREALGGNNLASIHPQRCAVYLATAIAQIESMEKAYCKQGKTDSPAIQRDEQTPQPHLHNPFEFGSTSAVLAKYLGMQGGHVTIATGCTGGVDALLFSLQRIRSGAIDIALTGSTEAPITPLVVAAFSRINATSKRNDSPKQASRPFDQQRDGFVLAEGCGIFVLEALESAQARGATIYAEINGGASVNNCFHMTDIRSDGQSIIRACRLALSDAQVASEAIDLINAHGSSTPQNDAAEATAFQAIFGERLMEIPVTSTKSQVGHALAAANSVEIISSILSLQSGIIAPTINYEHPDPHCRLSIVGNHAKQVPSIRHILKTSSGFGGIHSSIVLSRFEA